MSSSHYFVLKEAHINNNCPECFYQNGLKLTFKQKAIDNLFYSANSNETISEMHCENCNTKIYPGRWTDDIDRVVDYQNRALQLKAKSLTIKPLGWFIILLNLILVTVIILFATGVLSF